MTTRPVANKGRRWSAALGSQLFFYQVYQVAYGGHGFEFGGLELDAEAGLYGDDEVDVVEGIPLRHAGGGQLRRQDESVVVKDVVKDAGELGVDLLLLHGFGGLPFLWSKSVYRACRADAQERMLYGASAEGGLELEGLREERIAAQAGRVVMGDGIDDEFLDVEGFGHLCELAGYAVRGSYEVAGELGRVRGLGAEGAEFHGSLLRGGYGAPIVLADAQLEKADGLGEVLGLQRRLGRV